MAIWRNITFALGLIALAVVGVYTLAAAQDREELEERNALVEFVEGIISTPDRQIRLGTISGALSSNVSFSEITIADRDGVWLTIDNVRLVWSRAALVFGRLEISELQADQIIMERRPLPPEDAIPDEARLTVPELPVATNIESFAVPRVAFGEEVFGLSSELSVEGRLRLADGDLDTHLDIDRLDGPGGSLDITALFDSGAETLDLDISLSEPEDGVVANLLNLQGRPALTFTVAGAGPLQDYSADISLIADGEELLSGSTEIARVPSGFRLIADLEGRLGDLAPPDYADLFGDISTLALDAVRTDDGAVSISRARIVSGRMSLDASAELAPDWFPVSFAFDARLGTETDEPVVLPFGDGITVGSAHILAEVGGENGESWSAEFDLRELVSGTISAERATLTAGGAARNRAVPEEREVTFELSGAASGLSSADPAVAEALGSSLELAASGEWAHGQPVEVQEARLSTDHIEAHFAGQIVDSLIEGDYRLAFADLSAFSDLAGRPLQGAIDLAASGGIGVGLDRLDLMIDGAAEDLAIGIEPLDNVFAGRTTLTGGVVRDEDGLRFDDLVLDNPSARARVSGVHGAEEVNVALTAELPDVSVVTDRAAGAARLDASLTGVADVPAIEATLTGEALRLLDRPFTDARAQFVGTIDGRDLAGEFSLTGFLDGVGIDASATVATIDGLYTLDDIALRAAGTALTGQLTVRPDGLLAGSLNVESPDLSVIAPLTLTELTGSISAAIELSIIDDGQAGHLVATARNLRAGQGFAVGSIDIDVRGENLRQAPILAGEIDGAGIVIGPIEIETLSATAERVGDRTEFAATADLTEGTVTATGRLVPDNGGLDIEFDTFELRDAAIEGTLAEPVVIAIRNGTVAIPSARLNIGGGSVVLAGQIGDAVDLRAQVSQLNLSVANAFAPGLGLTGTVSGSLSATGPAAAPRGSFQLQGSGLSTADLREVGVSAFAFEAQGEIADGRAQVQAGLTGGGISLNVAGAVPLTGAGLDLEVSGTVPLSLADLVLAERGASLAGTLNVNLQIAGSLSDPTSVGTLAADGATFADVDLGIQLTNITLRARFDAAQIVVETLTAAAPGGTIAATGTIGIGGGFPADLSATLTDFRYQDGRLLTAILSGNLTVTGPLLDQPVLAGVINVERAEISVPEQIPDQAAMLDVVHVAPSAPVLETLRRARIDERPREQRGGLILDLTLEAPARIFVRGRGIDAEFGGSLTLTGPVSDIRPIGSFTMRRGHISILGQRINFTTGSVTLFGDLDPVLNFVATSQVRSVTITANVTGRASDPDIVLSSVPELPQDEVLAQFLFGRSLRDLSPLQVAQLATAAAGLVGGQDGGGLLGQLRGATGLDELDIVTGEEGGVAVRAGRYVADNVYLGVQADQQGEAGVTVNLDVTDDLTARGELGTDGRSKIGIFFEREY